MSRPEDLPRAASPLKRRAGSAPPGDDPNATDVDMLALPPAANSENVSIADGDIIEGIEGPSQDEGVDSLEDDASTSAQVDDQDEDTPDINRNLNNLDMDRSSVYDTQVGSDMEDNAPTADNPGGGADDAQRQWSQEEQTQERDAGGIKTLHGQNDSSTSNTDEAADSDAKTADTVGTSTSVEESAKNSKSTKSSHPAAFSFPIANFFLCSLHSRPKV